MWAMTQFCCFSLICELWHIFRCFSLLCEPWLMFCCFSLTYEPWFIFRCFFLLCECQLLQRVYTCTYVYTCMYILYTYDTYFAASDLCGSHASFEARLFSTKEPCLDYSVIKTGSTWKWDEVSYTRETWLVFVWPLTHSRVRRHVWDVDVWHILTCYGVATVSRID